MKNLYDSELESIKRLTEAVEKTVSQCENVVPLDCGLEEIKPALTLAKEETKWNLPLDLEKVSETKFFYTREHAQLVNAIAEKSPCRKQLLRFRGGNLYFPEFFCAFVYLLLVILWYKY